MHCDNSRSSAQEFEQPVPDFSLPTLDGVARDLQFFIEGKKGLVVFFWSETCSHCQRYDGYFNCFAERYPQLGLVAIASRQGEDPEQIRATAAERNLRFPILYDSGSLVAKRWYAQLTPRVYLIDAGRHLLYRGAIDNFRYPEDSEYVAYLEPAIESFLSGKPIERRETANFGCEIRSIYYSLSKPFA